MSTPYLPPLDQLLVLGEPEFGHAKPWPDYLSMGFTCEHVPELIRMLGDHESGSADDEDGEEDSPAVYGVVHAWRTLALLRAEAAIEPLVRLLGDGGDWEHEELPMVLGMIGPAALEPLRVALPSFSRRYEPWDAAAAAAGLVEVARRFPETREVAVGALTRQLRWWARHDPVLNTMLIHDLVELKAVEAAPVIEEAFAAGAVETGFEDDWEDVQVSLGLLPGRITVRERFVPRSLLRPTPAPKKPAHRPAAAPKRRRKAGKASRRRKHK